MENEGRWAWGGRQEGLRDHGKENGFILVALGSHWREFPWDNIIIWFTFYCGGKTDGARVEVEDALGRHCSSPGDDGHLGGEFMR